MNSMRRRLMVLLAVILLFFQLISVIWLTTLSPSGLAA